MISWWANAADCDELTMAIAMRNGVIVVDLNGTVVQTVLLY
jgi:hypothetical protein